MLIRVDLPHTFDFQTLDTIDFYFDVTDRAQLTAQVIKDQVKYFQDKGYSYNYDLLYKAAEMMELPKAGETIVGSSGGVKILGQSVRCGWHVIEARRV